MVRRPLVVAVALTVLAATAPLALAGRDSVDVLSPTMRRLVTDHRDGDVAYLASVTTIDDALRGALAGAGARVRHEFPEIGWVALSSAPSAVERVAVLPQVASLRPDELLRVLDMDVRYTNALPAFADQTKRGTSDVRADDLWARGVTGTGVVVGVADSGLDQTHPDLDGDKVAGFADCTTETCLPSFGVDDHGHGTHVSSIAAGTGEGALAGGKRRFPGTAPGARLAGARVCGASGSCLNSAVMAGLRWLATDVKDGGAGADVVNVSLGGGRLWGAPTPSEQVTNADPQAQLVNALAERYNVVFTIAAGNSGPVIQSVGTPSIASQAISVGATVTDFDLDHPVEQTEHGEFGNVRPEAPRAGATAIAGFSSRGPSGDRLIKPEVTAPGSYYIAAEAKVGEVAAADAAHGNKWSSDPTYAVLSGTSMSSPAAAGVAALLIDGFRKATGASPRYWEVKAALSNTAGTHAFEGSVTGLLGTVEAKLGGSEPDELYPLRNQRWVGGTGEGAGRIDAVAALAALTSGVVAYIPRGAKLDDIHDQQPNWALNDLGAGDRVTQGFVLHSGPRMAAPATATFRVDTGAEAAGVHALPAGWLQLPGATTVQPGGKDTPITLGVAVPPGAAPGQYAGAVVASVKLTPTVTQHVRIPVQLFVRLAGGAVEGPIWASESTDYSLVGAASGDIHTDWIAIPIHVPANTDRVDLRVWDVAGRDHMDVLAFTPTGQEIDSTLAEHPEDWVPGGAAWAPTDAEFPSEITLFDDADFAEVKLPTTVWLMVSDTGTDEPGFARFHLEVDIVPTR